MKINKKNIFIILLVLAIIILSIVLVVKSMNKKSTGTGEAEFIKDLVEIQNNMSYYIGNTYSDTFGIYTKEEIATATKKDDDKNSKISNITAIVDVNNKIISQNGTCYKISEDAYKSLLNVELPKYEGITWYLQDGSLIKIHIETKPNWWTNSLNLLEI